MYFVLWHLILAALKVFTSLEFVGLVEFVEEYADFVGSIENVFSIGLIDLCLAGCIASCLWRSCRLECVDYSLLYCFVGFAGSCFALSFY